MKIRHPFLLFLLVIIAFGMANSLFRDEPVPKDPKLAEKELAEKKKFNKNHCKEKDLIYVENITGRGECVTLEDLAKIHADNLEKMKSIDKSNANIGLE